jgi:hypothetical protein
LEPRCSDGAKTGPARLLLSRTPFVIGAEAGYEGGFIDSYIMPVLYPIGLTRNVQYALGSFALLINVVAYTMYFRRRRRSGL